MLNRRLNAKTMS